MGSPNGYHSSDKFHRTHFRRDYGSQAVRLRRRREIDETLTHVDEIVEEEALPFGEAQRLARKASGKVRAFCPKVDVR